MHITKEAKWRSAYLLREDSVVQNVAACDHLRGKCHSTLRYSSMQCSSSMSAPWLRPVPAIIYNTMGKTSTLFSSYKIIVFPSEAELILIFLPILGWKYLFLLWIIFDRFRTSDRVSDKLNYQLHVIFIYTAAQSRQLTTGHNWMKPVPVAACATRSWWFDLWPKIWKMRGSTRAGGNFHHARPSRTRHA